MGTGMHANRLRNCRSLAMVSLLLSAAGAVGLAAPGPAAYSNWQRPVGTGLPEGSARITLQTALHVQVPQPATLPGVPRTRLPGLSARKAAGLRIPVATLPARFVVTRAKPAKAPKPKPYFGLRWDPTEPVRPPDCTIAKGPAQILQVVNSRLTVLDDRGRIVLDDGDGHNFVRLQSLFASISGTEDVEWFGPRCLYDEGSQRFILAVAGADFAEKDEAWLGIAISSGPDPQAGAWTVYAYRTDLDGTAPEARWADAVDVGVDGTFLVATWNEQAFNTNQFLRSRVRVFDKVGLISGEQPAYVDFSRLQDTNGDLSFAVRPCRHRGNKSAFYLVNSKPLGGATLELWRLTGTPEAPVLDSMTVTGIYNYAVPPDARQTGVPTSNFPGALDTGDTRVLSAVADGDRIWTTLNTSLDGLVASSAIHISELDGAAGSVVQSRGIGATGWDYFFAALDTTAGTKPGVAILFGASSPKQAPSLRYSSRNSGMSPGEFRVSKPLITGKGKYDPLAPRDPSDPGPPVAWGRYFSAARDPARPYQVLLCGAYSDATASRDPRAWATKLQYVKP